MARSNPAPLRRSLVAASAFLAIASCGSGTPDRPRDVILITIDTLRADHLGIYGYGRDTSPGLDRFFANGAVFERSYSAEASTAPSVASILSGLLPQEHRVRLFYQLVPEDVPLLPELLPASYQTAAFVSNMVLTDDAMGMASRFDRFDDFVDTRESSRKVFERDAERTTDAALAWLATERDASRPLFLWVHYIDPHGPYRPPANWEVPFDPPAPFPIPESMIPEYTREPDQNDGNDYVHRYDAEIHYADAQVARLLEAYGRMRPIDDALTILTSDHGESMMEHERWFTHGYHVYEEVVRVPLLVRGPGVEAGRFDAPVSGLDIASTILAFAGVERPELRGADLRSGSALDPERAVFLEASQKQRQWRSVVQGSEKWIVAVRGKRREVIEAARYALDADPHELEGAAFGAELPDDSDALARLRELIASDPDPSGIPAEWAKGIKLDQPKVAPGVSAEARARLRALGY